MMKYTGKYYRIEIPLRCKERAKHVKTWDFSVCYLEKMTVDIV